MKLIMVYKKILLILLLVVIDTMMIGMEKSRMWNFIMIQLLIKNKSNVLMMIIVIHVILMVNVNHAIQIISL